MSRKNVRVVARESMMKFGYDPLDVMIACAQAEDTSSATKLAIAETLLPYMYPKLSNVTIEGEVSMNPHAETQAELMRRVLDSPELADAAQKLSLAAAEAALSTEARGEHSVN